MPQSPTQRGMKLLREFGWQGEVVEVFVKHSGSAFGYKKDVLGLFDAMLFMPSGDKFICLGAQFCAWGGVSAHRKKAEQSPWLIPWLESGNGFAIYGFHPWENEERRDECRIEEAAYDRILAVVRWQKATGQEVDQG